MDESSLFIAYGYPIIPAPILKDSIELPFQLCWESNNIDVWSICDLCSIPSVYMSSFHQSVLHFLDYGSFILSHETRLLLLCLSFTGESHFLSIFICLIKYVSRTCCWEREKGGKKGTCPSLNSPSVLAGHGHSGTFNKLALCPCGHSVRAFTQSRCWPKPSTKPSLGGFMVKTLFL